MSELAQTPAARQEEARARIKAREDGIRANAIKQGRELERKEMFNRLGVQRYEEASQLNQLRAERDERPTPDAERKHVRGALGWGMLWGFITGGAFATIVIMLMQGIIWDTAARSFREQAMTGAMLSTQPDTR
jgi:hypothetical protein